MIKEAEYVNQIIQEAALLHLDRSSIDTWHPQPVKRKLYPFQADDDYISEGFKDPTINAFALPGGKVIIQTGLIEHAKSWEEVLGVVSHELAHVTRRHHMRGIINNLGLYVIISSLIGDITAISGTIVNMGGDLASLANSRDFETEADETGLDYLIAAGINPQGLVSFFKTLEDETPNKLEGYTSFMSTHPATADRIDHLNKIIKDKKIKIGPIKDDFNQYKKIINK